MRLHATEGQPQCTVASDGLRTWLDQDGIIEPDSQAGKILGFTSDRFDGWLWKTGDQIMISFIESKTPGQGHLRQLFDRIEAACYRLAVPTPLGRMQRILEARGMVPILEETELGTCEVWRKP